MVLDSQSSSSPENFLSFILWKLIVKYILVKYKSFIISNFYCFGCSKVLFFSANDTPCEWVVRIISENCLQWNTWKKIFLAFRISFCFVLWGLFLWVIVRKLNKNVYFIFYAKKIQSLSKRPKYPILMSYFILNRNGYKAGKYLNQSLKEASVKLIFKWPLWYWRGFYGRRQHTMSPFGMGNWYAFLLFKWKKGLL